MGWLKELSVTRHDTSSANVSIYWHGSVTLLFCLYFSLGVCAETVPAEKEPNNPSTSGITTDPIEIGRRIYQEGILPNGQQLIGMLPDNMKFEGQQASCANCHRPSGMGTVEGENQIQPITGKFLFAKKGDMALATMDTRIGKRFNQSHEPYTDESLAKAISEGMTVGGRKMNPMMMPLYPLAKPEMDGLIAYLKQLSSQTSPGVTEQVIHFATVIAPGVSADRRKLLHDMIHGIIVQKNGSTVVGNRGSRHHMASAAELVLGTERKWEVHEWELQGEPESWLGQLEKLYQSQPVFALVSGVSDTTWQPVQAFCQQQKVPCWFPSVYLPPLSEQHYSIYFSRGLALEAEVLGKYLRDNKKARPKSLIQVYRDDYVGKGAAEELTRVLADSGIKLENRILKNDNPEEWKSILSGLGKNATVMLWLRPADLSALGKSGLTPPATAFFSTLLAGGEKGPIPDAWKANTHLVYPYDLPKSRQVNMRNFYAWLNVHKIPLADEPFQAEIFFALSFLTDTVSEMLDNLYRDYLVERAENMLSRSEGGRSEQQARDFEMWVGPHDPNIKHTTTTIYPHLSLGDTQRFASKGAYIVRFDKKGELVVESDWIVPK